MFLINFVSATYNFNTSDRVGMIVYWAFNDSVNDFYGRYNLTKDDSGSYHTGISGNSLYSNTTNYSAYMSGINQFAFNNSNFTISFWFKPYLSSGGVMINANSWIENTAWAINLGSNVIQFYCGTDLSQLSSSSIYDGKWHLITIRRNTTATLGLSYYLDGNFISQSNCDRELNTTPTLFNIGGTGAGKMNGSVDELIFWNRSLGYEDICILANISDTQKPLLTIQQPTGTKTSRTITINATGNDSAITCSKTSSLQTCYYNITRGASLETANTNFLNLSQLWAIVTLSGDASYVIWVGCNDTLGNSNYSSSNFTISGSGTTPPSISPSGGGSIIQKMVSTEVEESICIPFKETFYNYWDKRKDGYTWIFIKGLWQPFWDHIICESASSIVPI